MQGASGRTDKYPKFMKRIFFFFAAAMMAGNMMAQTAVHNHTVTLNDGDTWEFPMTNPYEDAEIEISKNYAHQIESSALFRAMGGEEFLYGEVRGLMHSTAAGEFDKFHFQQGYLGHKLIQNKRFRDFLADRFCAILKDMCRLYPASAKKNILSLLDRAINIINYMGKHTYTVTEATITYKDGDTRTIKALQKDGKIIGGNMTDEELDIIYGMEGFFARRMLIDNISLSEIRAYLQTARKAVAGEDVSRKPEYIVCYTINNDLKVVQATDRVFCRFRNGKQEDGVSSVTYLHDATGTYYKILGPYIWQDYDGRWQCVATSTLYDSDGNTIYTEVIPRD